MARSILVQLPSSFLSVRLVSVHVVHLYSSIETAVTWKKSRFVLSDRSGFYMTERLLIADSVFARFDAVLEEGYFVH